MEDPVPGEETQETETPGEETPDAPEETVAEGEGEEEEALEEVEEPADTEPSEEKTPSWEELTEILRDVRGLLRDLRDQEAVFDILASLQDRLGEGDEHETNFEISGKEVDIKFCEELNLHIDFHVTFVKECPGKHGAQPEDNGEGGPEE